MKAMSKKLLSLLLAVIMLVGVLPATALADEVESNDEVAATSYTVTLDAAGGTMNGLETATKTVEDGKQIGTLPTPVKEGYTFLGWYNGETLVEAGTLVEGEMTLTAKWELKVKNLLVKGVVGENVNGAWTIATVNVAEQTNILNYLKSTFSSTSENFPKTGYTIEGDGNNPYWYYYNGSRLLVAQN